MHQTLVDPPAIAERVTLYFRQGGSDKVYHAALEPSGGGFTVNFAFGRRGSTLQTGTKTLSPVSHDAARKIYDKLIKEKTAKGYTPGEDGTPYRQNERQDRVTGILPQLLNPIEESEAGKYLTDDRWWMQEKFDGKRLLIRKDGRDITAINRSGLAVGLPQNIADAVAQVRAGQCILDGEAVGDVYHAFDLLERGEMDMRPSPYSTRFWAMVDLVDSVASDAVRFASTAVGLRDKQSMLEQMRRAKKEGVVFKARHAAHTPGRPASGGSQLKLKFYATASCIVAAANSGKRSVALELIEGAKHVGVGNVTVPAHQPIPTPGQVVEVRYLYAYPGGSLYQPLLLGVRDDVDREDCRLDQLKYRAIGEEGDA